MAIIRNERARNQEPEVKEEPELEEEEIDYAWHPTEEEYVSPLTTDQWAELLSSPSFVDTDQAKAICCLREYGAPATFQQLSIRYRGTMGRYRRWLGEAAQTAGEQFGVEAPRKDQYGMDEWWPLLYQTRATGKVGAGIFEMMLRPEVEEAFLKLEEQEREARKAENIRNLKRIEQLERARQEERERRAAQEAEREARAIEREAQKAVASEVEPVAESAAPVADAPVESEPQQESQTVVVEAADPVFEPDPVVLPTLQEFLRVVSGREALGGARFVPASVAPAGLPVDMAAPIDYALRYAERLREALSLMGEALPRFSAALVARALGDESVERLQEVLNGQRIPAFSYLDAMREQLFVNVDRLETMDGCVQDMPVYAALDELWCPQEVAQLIVERRPCEIAYVVDDAEDRRTGVIVRFAQTSCALLSRVAVPAQADGRKRSPELDVFVRMVDELDEYARVQGIERTSRVIKASQWDALATGVVWPGTMLQEDRHEHRRD